MLSILMPAKNEALFIEAALRSIEKINNLEYEVIVVDDGSDDETCNIVEELAFSFVKLIKSGGVGKAQAFNLAFENASGDVFILLAADDLLIAESIHERIAPIQAVDKPQISYCKLKSFSADSKYNAMTLPKNPTLGLESGGCMAFNRSFAQLAFPIPSFLPNEDVWMMLHARYSSVEATHTPTIGISYRIHENNSYKRGVNYSQVNEQMWVRQRAIFYFYENYKLKLPPQKQRALLIAFLLQLLRYLGFSKIICFIPEAPLKERIKLLLNSSARLYAIRERFYSFFSGR
ncbi:Glycosyl transferase family 2 [Pseudomonas sp. NFPP10]|uniref:glycosyltransferase family 2 protein n=1 Tax=Pseudomonas TaxID=286 RepID=UPI00087FC733|nr:MULTISPECIES: glycosyltransferase family 2 protein [Pseudomonas]PZP07980.1 MAG: glycosyltransferase family 2 protein [Pseudomonas protegens]SDA19302.1 Glycosyl transferase family 2 [Pseudomonas sp. NFPP12]SEL11837.1 Glycosyl transferase family 2 [Pseudomonas sp. NFPP10]SFI71142.1 Glycosyl transferase family 2 [Pseudomonas sp. NFPP08]SFM50030.1 Glycosyl transferase family 2 [Pseudomonas sp. NFPP05]